MMTRTGVAMSIPHYINEDKSDMRGIKPGWYAMEDNGKLSSGPFSGRHDCLSRDTQAMNPTDPLSGRKQSPLKEKSHD
jgi:hypothetical protein